MALQGNVDLISHDHVAGWAWDADHPDTPVSLVISANGQVLGRILANRYRADLEAAGIGKGTHSFEFRLSAPLSPLRRHVITARREGDGAHIDRSPRTLEPTDAFDRAAQEAMAQVLSTVADEADFVRRLAFLNDQIDRLRQRYADFRSGAEQRHRRRYRQWSEPMPGARGEEEAPERRRALVVDAQMPSAAHDAGSNAILSHMRALQRLGYEVTFAPAHLRGDGAALEAEGIACCLHPWYASVEEVLKRQHGTFDLVYLHRVSTAGLYTGLVRDHQPQARLVYSVADLHHLRVRRQAEVESRPELFASSERTKLVELSAALQADAVITHSTAEAEVLGQHMWAGKIHVVPWSLTPRPTAVPFSERRGLAFVGGFAHQPNVDAALWFVDAVMPELEGLGFTIPCRLVGSDMPDSLRNLRRHDVDPVGFVPDLATVFDAVRLTVAPLAYGAGIKGKVLDSLAAGVPCVCTPAAAEGMDLPEPLLRLVASSPADLARSIRALHDDAALNEDCAQAGLAYIAERTSEERVDNLLRAAIGRDR